MFGQVWTICRNTFTESIRQPIFTIMMGLTILLLILNVAWSAYTMDDDNKLLIDAGLGTILLAGLMLSAFTATGVLSREIDNKTVLAVISKPIGRPAFVIGKFAGVMAAIALAAWVWSIVFLLTVRHKVLAAASDQFDMPVILFGGGAILIALFIAVWGNYFYRWVFSSTVAAILPIGLTIAYLLVLMINKEWQFQPITHEFSADPSIATNYAEDVRSLAQIMIALGMVWLGLAVISAIAIAASTRLGQVMTLVVCAAAYMLGLVSDYLFGRFADDNPLAALCYAVAPNMGIFWLADALTQMHPITWGYVGLGAAYAVLYIIAALGIAVALFQTREAG
jgi:ABC-type transport system involved in multi-copper enzyme maturation permease subunit